MSDLNSLLKVVKDEKVDLAIDKRKSNNLHTVGTHT